MRCSPLTTSSRFHRISSAWRMTVVKQNSILVTCRIYSGKNSISWRVPMLAKNAHHLYPDWMLFWGEKGNIFYLIDLHFRVRLVGHAACTSKRPHRGAAGVWNRIWLKGIVALFCSQSCVFFAIIARLLWNAEYCTFPRVTAQIWYMHKTSQNTDYIWLWWRRKVSIPQLFCRVIYR